MPDDASELRIRSRHGALRDLVPAYGILQLLANLAVLAAALWIAWLADWQLPPILILFALLGWLSQFTFRPSVMPVSEEQAAIVEAELRDEGQFSQSEVDGRWRLNADTSWRWPHKFIEILRSPHGALVSAPRQWLEPIRDRLEWLTEKGWDGSPSHAVELGSEPGPKPLPWHAHVPTALLVGVMVPAWLIVTVADGDMLRWGISGAALMQGRLETIALHIFAHGGLLHLVMNISALVAIGGSLTARLGTVPLNWARFLILFVTSGLAGAALFLALHPSGAVPMVGASGALYGLIGLLVRLPHAGGELLTFRSHKIRRIGWTLVKENLFLVVLLGLLAWSSGSAGGLAWEAHLGGFLFGFFIGPKFLPRVAHAA